MTDHAQSAKSLRNAAAAMLEQAYVLDGLQPYLITNLQTNDTYVGWFYGRPYEKQIAELMGMTEKQYATVTTLVEENVSFSELCGGDSK